MVLFEYRGGGAWWLFLVSLGFGGMTAFDTKLLY